MGFFSGYVIGFIVAGWLLPWIGKHLKKGKDATK